MFVFRLYPLLFICMNLCLSCVCGELDFKMLECIAGSRFMGVQLCVVY